MFTFGVTQEMIADQKMTPQLRNLLAYYVESTEKLFEQGIVGIKKLHSGKFSTLLASLMYREDIRILKKRNYDIFSTKIHLSKIQKARILLETIIMYSFWLLQKK